MNPELRSRGHGFWSAALGEGSCLKAKVIDLREHAEFVRWITDGGSLRMPRTIVEREKQNPTNSYDCYTGEDDWHTPDADQADGTDTDELDFPELIREVDEAIAEYEGAVFPMSDEKTPFDAAWCIANGETNECQCAAEVFMAIKASALTTTDWEARLAAGRPAHLILRKWYHIEPSMCFRCYVSEHGRLVGVSQKRLSEFYPFLAPEGVQTKVLEAAQRVFDTTIAKAVAEAGFDEKARGSEHRYSFDIYIVKKTNKAKVLGFHDWENLLLFSGDEAELLSRDADGCTPLLRVIESRDEIVECGVASSLKAGVPEELKTFKHLVSAAESLDNRTGGAVQSSVDDMIRLMMQQDGQES